MTATLSRRVSNAASTLAASRWKQIVRARSARSIAGARIEQGAQIHLGCGPVRLEGWLNIDRDRQSDADLYIDLRGGLPLTPDSVARIYSEHVLEHFSMEDGQALLNDCFDALQPGGILRIAMPDLKNLVTAYLGDWQGQDWIRHPGFSDIDTAAHMLNVGFRSWGHLYLYDLQDLTLRLAHAGFSHVETCGWGESDCPALRNLERRPDSLLIVEATR
jgi:predicted SAM-dependent methyltransferase